VFGTVRLQATDELIAGSGSEQSNRARLREQLYRKDDAMREVVDGVIEIPIGYVNAFAVVVDDGVVLVDTGIPGRADKIESAVEEAQRRIGEVHTIC
jgi:glyoxylase-like metal-dependent hydrolase (beta-lactamase superfamily II)